MHFQEGGWSSSGHERAAASSNRGPVHHRASTPPFPPIESTSTDGRVGRPSGTGVQLAAAGEHADRKGKEEDAPGDPPRSRSSSTSRCGQPRGLPRFLRRSPPPLRPVPDPATTGPCLASPRTGSLARRTVLHAEDRPPRRKMSSSPTGGVFRAAGEGWGSRIRRHAEEQGRGSLAEDGRSACSILLLPRIVGDHQFCTCDATTVRSAKEMHPYFAHRCWSQS
jgi:hypothetical protein